MGNNSSNVQLVYEIQGDEVHQDLPVKGTTTLYEGDAVSMAAGLARQLLGGTDTVFGGFALRKADNSAGADSDITVRLRQRGHVKLAVAAGGVLANSIADEGLPVYATDGATFTGLTTGALKIGKIARYISSGVYLVNFEATSVQSI